MNKKCPLCNEIGNIFYQHKTRLYHQCSGCSAIFVDQSLILSEEDEKSRYEEHNNDVNDKNFQKFVSPITSRVMDDFSPEDKGLDFGAGFAPVITKVLSDNNYNVKPYDPFFQNFPGLLNKTYNYITSCEVIEHFNDPLKEFALLFKLLKPGGKLYIHTWLYSEEIDFHKWNYKDDHTHIFIFHKNTIKWIKEKFEFKDMQISGRLIIFDK